MAGGESLFEFFDRICCINLDRRRDRWDQAQREFARMGLTERVVRIPAIVPPNGNASLGCKLSHLEIISDAQDRGLESVFIFEDDVVFSADAAPVLERALRELQRQSWEMLYLGAILLERPSLTSRHLAQLNGAYSLHAYAVHRRAFNVVLSSHTLDRNQLHRGYEDAIDRFYSEQIHPRKRCFCVRPMICRQRPGLSDIEHEFRDHTAAYRASEAMLRRQAVALWCQTAWRFMTARR